ncbi:putative secreted protein (Por secretion system target) [Pontibacter ummariensis]|uniref:Por secretion system C-terminal sorting domain-containing protein n=1 Tax=Pontibacter ummariensis TaxID=1610492 RepID=A0A239CM17_9BACT|nr:M43 family zinc metalloprotease [Pontibacter ummariensis]PRY14937.1 putative secreted protein (Por secretion system target) [Pontibacter ummariensis]SNS21195.1 Por secretion system C-terminal sorting domain-containing protein [Pontibacter ummariensis]
MRIFTFFVFLLASALPGFAQTPSVPGINRDRTCATDAFTHLLQTKDPAFKQRQQELQQITRTALIQQSQGQALRAATAITIPVVFHVVYNNASENISDDQLLSQLEVLNADFSRTNADAANTPAHFLPFAADTRVQFCMAVIDPNGDPTNGITRTRTTRTSFGFGNDYVKSSANGGVDAWDRDQYLNIWVCNIDGNILGYATPPGVRPFEDGVVLHYGAVGAAPVNTYKWNYNKGRTATHEVGHWLGLKHIWGNGVSCTDSDGIDDTPNQEQETTGYPTGIITSCDNGPYGNMYQNYMDYTDDACMNLFTKGQADYMNAVLSTSRSSILTSPACIGNMRSDFQTAVPYDTLTIAGSSINFTDASIGARPTSWYWEFEGGVPAVSTQENPTVLYPQPGKYSVKLTIANDKLSSTKEKTGYVHVTVNDLVVYPSPASDFITIEQPARVWVRQVELVNQLGQVMVNAEIRDRVLRLDVRNLPSGVYILRIKSTNGTDTRKVSVVR